MADTISALIMPTAGSHLSIYQSVSYPEIHFGNHSRKSSAHAECTKATKYLPMKTPPIAVVLFLLIVGSMLPMRASAQPDLEQRVTRLEHKAAADEGVGMAVFVSAAF